jgi:hypothetical protein
MGTARKRILVFELKKATLSGRRGWSSSILAK